MSAFLLKYDTYPLGKKGDKVNIPPELEDLLDEKYLFFSAIRKIKDRSGWNDEQFIFAPVYDYGQVDYRLYRKSRFNKDGQLTKKAMQLLLPCLYA